MPPHGAFGFGKEDLCVSSLGILVNLDGPLLLEKRFPSLKYSAPIGRHILLQQQRMQPTMYRVWEHARLTARFLRIFWRDLWDSAISRRVSYFIWIVAHRGLTMGTWAAVLAMIPPVIDDFPHRSL